MALVIWCFVAIWILHSTYIHSTCMYIVQCIQMRICSWFALSNIILYEDENGYDMIAVHSILAKIPASIGVAFDGLHQCELMRKNWIEHLPATKKNRIKKFNMITNCEKYIKCVKISIFICNRRRECVRFFLYDDLNRICIKLDYCNVSSKLIFHNDIFLWTNICIREDFMDIHMKLSSFHQ